MSDAERREFFSLSRGERRAFIQERLRRQGGPAAAKTGDKGLTANSPREVQARAGLFNTGVIPVYPKEARCLEVNSLFGDQTRFDGSRRTPRFYQGYHEGFDISADEGTPLVAIADGEVVHKFSGGQLVGHQIYLRHAPENTGLPVYIYSKYKHFREAPDLAVGDRVKMGQVIGVSGKTGTTGGHFGRDGYPHLHLSIYVASTGDYKSLKIKLAPKDVRYLDPMALYLIKNRKVYDNHAVRALPEAKKTVKIPYRTTDGATVPEDTKLIWPFLCARVSAAGSGGPTIQPERKPQVEAAVRPKRQTDAKRSSGRAADGVTPNLYFIDAQSQMDQNVDEDRVISLMDHAGVYRTILATHMRRPWQDIPKFARSQPGRIVPSVRIKGPGYHGRAPAARYYDRLAAQVGDGGFGALGEVLLWHDSKGGRFQEIRVDFDDELVRAGYESARSKGWPFIIHIEFNALSGGGYRSYMEKLERFLGENRDHPFVMIHMGQLEAGPVRRLLAAHSNLHFMTSHASPYYEGRKSKFINMFDGESLKPEWRKLIADYPDRFVFALDNVFSRFWTTDEYLGNMTLWWRALSELPDAHAHAVAHGNAERLWKLPPKPENVVVTRPWESLKKLGSVTGYSAGRMRR